MKWRNHAAPSEIGALPREVDATPSHSLFVFSSCFTLLINKRLFFHLSTTLYPTDRLTSSASSASSRFLSLARVGLYFEASTKILGSRTGVNHPIWCVLCTVLRYSGAAHSKIRQLASALGCAIFALDVNHPLRGVLCEAVRGFPAFNSNIRYFAKAFSSAICAAGEVDRPVFDLLPAALSCSITAPAAS